MRFLSTVTVAALLSASNVVAHPGHDINKEIAERAAFLKDTPKRDLSHCAAKLKARGITAANNARRAAIAKEARKKRGIADDAPFLKARTFEEVLAKNHTSPIVYAPGDEEILFSGNHSCILQPETTEGPYYVAGEYVRENLIEDQEGVELILDTQVIDIQTCEPVPEVYLEIWNCNTTGVYGGVVAGGNGIGSAAPENINATWLRGIQATDDLGVAKFTTLFPGHYAGRTTHIHVAAHFNGTTFANGTYNGGYVSHVGQIFFDQDLIHEVEATPIYNTNTQTLLLNTNDGIFSQEASTSDPVITYSLLGETVEEGVFGWLTFGIDLSANYTVRAAVTLTENGGVANPGGGGGPGGPPPPGFPSGIPTSRPASSSTASASATESPSLIALN
ncbi:Intradiol ring-cleavage dioxygenase [Bisporella sp. PMI_857]|nr:Intradiol ring-cleavage dioxygenase [Bisporella sp. PMI_857]